MRHTMWKSTLCIFLIVALLAAPVSALAASKAYILRVSTNSRGTYVRAGSSMVGGNGNSAIIGYLKNGSRVLYYGEKYGQMLRILTPTGKMGYVYQGNLKTYGAMNRNQIYVTRGSTPVFKRSGSTLKRLGTLGSGIPVILYRSIGDWAYVKGINGGSGFIRLDNLTRA